MVARVRAKRAIVAFLTITPITGARSSNRSMVCCAAGERLYI